MKRLIYFLPILFLVFSCEKEPKNTNDEELITTVELVFTDTQNAEVKSFLFVDEDGDGGNVPVITTDTLDANRTYSLKVNLLNESVSPADNITLEVEEEGDAHQFFFEIDSELDLNISYNDLDINGNPIGLVNTANTGVASDGFLKVILRHEPNKDDQNVSNGDITNAGGATDIELTFDVVIQ